MELNGPFCWVPRHFRTCPDSHPYRLKHTKVFIHLEDFACFEKKAPELFVCTGSTRKERTKVVFCIQSSISICGVSVVELESKQPICHSNRPWSHSHSADFSGVHNETGCHGGSHPDANGKPGRPDNVWFRAPVGSSSRSRDWSMRVKFKMQWRPQKVTDDRNEECLLKKSFKEWVDLA